MTNTISEHFVLDVLKSGLPPVFSRKFVEQMTGGLIKSHTLANLDSKGEGPPAFKLGKKVGYEKDSFIHWIQQRVS